jgi:hypothetical protein
VEYFNIDSYLEDLGIWRTRLESLALVGPRYARANAELAARCRELRPHVVWIDHGTWVRARTLDALRSNGAFVVGYYTDSLNPTTLRPRWSRSLLRRGIDRYDVFFTSMPQDHARISGGVRPRAELTYLGYDHERFDNTPLPPELAEKWSNDAIFVGHYQPRTEACILALIDSGVAVKVYGDGWPRARHRKRLGDHVTYRKLDDEEYVFALKEARIGLGFVSERNSNQTAGRSFEIPACGTFLLAIRTQQHQDCFEEGVEAEFFADHSELLRKARYYLEHADQREKIARSGHARCVQSDYSWARYMNDAWGEVRRVLNETDRWPRA